MDSRDKALGFVVFLLICALRRTSCAGVFRVRSKFAGLRNQIDHLREHDGRRHGRLLADAVDLPLGGNALVGVYYTEIWIGNPAKHFFVQVDTGSDQLWVNCIQCHDCPKKSNLGVELTLYDPVGSTTGSLVSCSDNLCSVLYSGQNSGCTANIPCRFSLRYADGSTSSGYFMEDHIHYNRVIDDFQSIPVKATVVFGCSVRETGLLNANDLALDGIMGFGQSDASVISQLASSGKVNKMFSHCLDGRNGGGIFAIGHVVEPRMKMTPIVANQSHYNVYMKAIDVGGTMLQLPSSIFVSGDGVGDIRGTIIDSGTALTYIAEEAFEPLMKAIVSYGPHVQFYTSQTSRCFQYIGSVDEAFPSVTFYFENSVTMKVFPHQYLNQISDFNWCIAFQNSGSQSRDSRGLTVLGDIVLANMLVFYDLESQSIGWTNYDCSSSIKVKDLLTGNVYSVGARHISFAYNLYSRQFSLILYITIILLHLINFRDSTAQLDLCSWYV